MIKQKFKKNPILWIFILICIVGFSYFNWIKSLPQSFTVGKILKVYKPLKGNTRVQYFYQINGKEEKETVSNYGYEKVALPGRRFLVQYPEGYENEGVMLLDHPVPDSIDAPSEGWDEKPDLW